MIHYRKCQMVQEEVIHLGFRRYRNNVWRVGCVDVVLKGDRGCLSMNTISLVVDLEYVVWKNIVHNLLVWVFVWVVVWFVDVDLQVEIVVLIGILVELWS